MATAQRHYTIVAYSSATARSLPLPESMPTPRLRVVTRLRKRENWAWVAMITVSCFGLLVLGILSVSAQISQTSEVNRRSSLYSQFQIENKRAEELALKRARVENDTTVAADAARFGMIRRTDRDAVTIQ